MATKPITISSFGSLDNKHDPSTFVELKKAFTFLQEANNIDITDNFKVKRRNGFSSVDAGDFHSLWSTNDSQSAFTIKDGVLVHIDGDLNITQLSATVFGSSSVYFAETDNCIYASDGKTIIKITDGIVSILSGAGSYDLTSRTLSPDDNEVRYDSPPAGILLSWMFGRLWSVTDKAIFYSRSYEAENFDLSKDYLDIQNVTHILPVNDGIYIGTTTKVYFLAGGNPNLASNLKEVCSFGSVLGTGILVDATCFDLENVSGKIAIWESQQGKIIGLNTGSVLTTSSDRTSVPSADSGSMFIRENNGMSSLVSSLKTNGAYGSNMRATDYAEAEVIKQQ